MKKVSVIVPAFNTEKYLHRCLDSLVNQTLKDIEIIVVNDCSTDNSRKILDYYEEKYKSILKVFHNESNRGIGYSRNLGMEKAEGEYLCFLDSDDWVKLDMYEKMYKKAKLESLDLVICNYDKKKMDNDGNFSKIENDYVIPEYSVTCLKSTPELLLTVNMGPTNKLYKKTLLKNIRFPIDLKYEDMIVIVKSLANYKRIGFVQLFTLGGFFIWWAIDLISMCFNTYKDKYGNELEDYNGTLASLVLTGTVLVVMAIAIMSLPY